jgi:transcriptional regulator with XRE-family HTH domain
VASICIRELIRNSRTGTPALTKCQTRIHVIRDDSHKTEPIFIPDFPVEFGVHLFTTRTQRGISETYAANELDISLETYRSWENDKSLPSISRMPSIIRFVGFCPYDASLAFRDKVILWRSLNGVSQRYFASMIEVDQSSLARWERGTGGPYKILLSRLLSGRQFLGELADREFREGTGRRAGRTRAFRRHRHSRARICPKLNVGSVVLRFPPNLYVPYDVNWPAGKKLEVWRTSLGLSQRDFGKLTGFAHQSICRWEKGRRVPQNTHIDQLMKRLSKILSNLTAC